MGFDLVSKKGEIEAHLNIWHWKAVLEDAIENGWKPRGTVGQEPTLEGGNWPGPESFPDGYDTNDGQLVTDKDAKNMHGALKNSKYKESEYVEKFIGLLKDGAFYIY